MIHCLLSCEKWLSLPIAVPVELLAAANTVIAFFLPFTRELSLTNRSEGLSSGEWAAGYIETNELIARLGRHVGDVLAADGHESAAIPATHNWIEGKAGQQLVSPACCLHCGAGPLRAQQHVDYRKRLFRPDRQFADISEAGT